MAHPLDSAGRRPYPFDGVTLDPTEDLTQSIIRLRRACFLFLKSLEGTVEMCGMTFYSPLTFRYVLSDCDALHVGARALAAGVFLPVFQKYLETIQAWEHPADQQHRRPVWQVKVSLPFNPDDLKRFEKEPLVLRGVFPILRLVLVPISGYEAAAAATSGGQLTSPDSADHHFFDTFELELKTGHLGITFLLEDRSLLDTHCGIVVNLLMDSPVFLIGRFEGPQLQVDPFDLPFLFVEFKSEDSGECGNTSSPHLYAQSCQEAEGSYNIRLEIHRPALPPSGLKVIAEDDGPCESAHRITVSLDGMKPLTVSLPHPILPDTIKAVLQEEDLTLEVVLVKALKELWPEDVNPGQKLRWEFERLEPWTAKDALNFHISSQFRLGHLEDTADVLSSVRKSIRMLFCLVQEGQQCFEMRMEGSTEWFIRAHPPVLISPQGTPSLWLTAVDQRLADRLQRQGKQDKDQFLDHFVRVFPDAGGISATIGLQTTEEVDLFRYLLRLNSARIRASAWQLENLFQDGANPSVFLATFLRPLYWDDRDDGMNLQCMTDELKVISCARCFKTDPGLKLCGKCKSVAYCSVECQNEDWENHELTCFQA